MDIASVFSNNSLCGVQPEARPLTDSFGSEKRLEDVAPNLRGDSRPVISNLHDNVIFLLKRPNAKFPLASHCVNCVLDQIGPDLIQFRSERVHEERYRLIVTHDQDSPLQFMV